MSWLFSQALVEEYSAANCLDGILSAPSSGSPTPQAYLPPDKMTVFSRPSRFGMTFAALTETLGVELLTWFLADSRARTSAWPGKVPESAANDPACGLTWRASLARFDPASRLWKTAQLCLLGDLELSSVTWPRSGMTASGQCWELPTLARTTSVTGSGLWPTPTCPNDGRSVAHVTDWRSERTAYSASGKKVQVDLAQAVKRWSTPVASDTGLRKTPYAQGGTPLSMAATMWRTPSASVVEPKSTVLKLTGRKPSDPQVGLADQVGGSLNPTWVEWIMGWPLGWTDLKPLETDKYHCAQPAHGGC
jgi:hypothetical protein